MEAKKKLFGSSPLWRISLCQKDEMANPQVSVVLLEHPEQQNDPKTIYHAQYLIEGDIFSADQWNLLQVKGLLNGMNNC